MYKFPCGCTFKINNDVIKEADGLPSLDIDFYDLRDCSETWKLIDTGHTKGIFQLEKQLGQEWAKRVLPQSIDELAALISIIRPGTLQSMVDGKSMTACFADRKAGKEEIVYFYDVLEPILKETYGILVYQEQSIRIAKDLAGFSLQEADQLRKAVGKKDAALMTKTEKLFLDKAKDTKIINEEASKNIFGWIRESNRYAFNKCWSVNTIVTTPNGLKTLEEIKVGDKVLAPLDDTTDEFVEVVNKYHNGNKELYEITTESGLTVQATLDHKFLCEDGDIYPLWEIIEKDLKIMCLDDQNSV